VQTFLLVPAKADASICAFVARICAALSHHVPLGMTMSALKGVYDARAAESYRKRTVTPYSFCFNRIIDWILTSVAVGSHTAKAFRSS
jgi:hypothetical protein